MARYKDMEWRLPEPGASKDVRDEQAAVAVLMDIRDELKSLNAVLHCCDFLGMPRVLREIRDNTTRRTYTRRTAK